MNRDVAGSDVAGSGVAGSGSDLVSSEVLQSCRKYCRQYITFRDYCQIPPPRKKMFCEWMKYRYHKCQKITQASKKRDLELDYNRGL